MNRLSRPPAALLLALAAAFGTPGGAAAQVHAADAPRDINGHPFRTPTASPLESVLRVAPVRISRRDRDRTVALATLGAILGFRIHDGAAFDLAGALHGSGASRFDLGDKQNQFIEVTYRVGTYLRAGVGAIAARLELYHVSSHLGDEYLLATGLEPISSSREGVELLLQGEPLPGLVLYGGPGWIFRSTLPYESPSLRFGADWAREDRRFRPYAAVDAFAWSELDWDPTIAGEAGVAVGDHVRIGFLLGLGPSRADQFFRESETMYGLSISFHR